MNATEYLQELGYTGYGGRWRKEDYKFLEKALPFTAALIKRFTEYGNTTPSARECIRYNKIAAH